MRFFNSTHKYSVSILIVIVALIALAISFLLKQSVDKALAQEGGSANSKVSNAAMGQEIRAQRELSGSTSTGFVPVENDIGPLSDGSGVEPIPIGAFRNDGDNVDGWFNWFVGGYIRNAGSQYACFMAPTYPPAGATLTNIRISLLDKSSDKDLVFAELKRVRLATGVVDFMAGGDIPWNDPNPVELVASVASGTTVVSSNYAYYFHLCFPPDSDTDILLYGARLSYTP
ncbi:MAG: hypothetical protein KDJ52_34935 [Anaerolineae bacterium]|nr:hypothetical protein [Anaerolineae bacterium]